MIQNAYLNYLKEHYPQYIQHYYKRKESNDYVVNEFSSYTEEQYKEQICIKDTIAVNFLRQYIQNKMCKNQIPLFNKIEIETINQCNNICDFCPVNRFHDIRNHSTMTMELFEKIIIELEHLAYSGTINLSSNNEPLLDPYLIQRLKFTREHLPDAYIFIFTNGLLLTPQKLMQILTYVDFIHINNYNTTPELLSGHKRLQKELLENKVDTNKAEIHLRNSSECLSTRAGQAPNRKETIALTSPCILPFSQMVIRPNGQVSFCCNDAYGLYTMGDVSKQSLVEIWHGEEFCKSRANMMKNRSCQEPCRNCDMLFMPLAWEEFNL